MQFIVPALISLVITFFTTPIIIILAKRFGLVDDPSQRHHPAHIHSGIIPRAGGIALFIGIGASILICIPQTPIVTGILIGACILTVVGVLAGLS